MTIGTIRPRPTVYFRIVANEGDPDEVVLYAEDASSAEVDRVLSVWRNSVPQGRFVIEPTTAISSAVFAALPVQPSGAALVPGSTTRVTSAQETGRSV